MMVLRLDETLHRTSLKQQIYDYIEEQIINGSIQPGTKLGEEAIANQFGISRSPVREAVAELERAGFAERQGPRDRCVTVPNEKFIQDIYDVVAILEVGRAYLSSIQAMPQDHERLSSLLREMEAEQDNPERYRKLSDGFHSLVAQRCENQRLQSMIEHLNKYVRWFHSLYYDYHKGKDESMLREHKEILKYYAKKDLVGLTRIMQKHIAHQRDLVIEHWRKSTAKHTEGAEATATN